AAHVRGVPFLPAHWLGGHPVECHPLEEGALPQGWGDALRPGLMEDRPEVPVRDLAVCHGEEVAGQPLHQGPPLIRSETAAPDPTGEGPGAAESPAGATAGDPVRVSARSRT